MNKLGDSFVNMSRQVEKALDKSAKHSESQNELFKSQVEKFLTPAEASELELSMDDYKESVSEVGELTQKLDILTRPERPYKITIVLDPKASHNENLIGLNNSLKRTDYDLPLSTKLRTLVNSLVANIPREDSE